MNNSCQIDKQIIYIWNIGTMNHKIGIKSHLLFKCNKMTFYIYNPVFKAKNPIVISSKNSLPFFNVYPEGTNNEKSIWLTKSQALGLIIRQGRSPHLFRQWDCLTG